MISHDPSMKSVFSFWHLLTLLALVLPSLYLLYTWPALPNQIPIHFGVDGAANGFTGKHNVWLLCGALPLGTYLLLLFLPRLDPKQRLDTRSANYQKLMLALVGLVSGLALYSLYAALHPAQQSGQGLLVMIGLFFVLIGNYLTTVQPNYFVGFRTPWTLEFPRIWARVHRVGGRLFFAVGVLTAAVALLASTEAAGAVLLAGVGVSVVVIYGYSYRLYRQETRAANAG
jgi:uncharacterized membrane protein